MSDQAETPIEEIIGFQRIEFTGPPPECESIVYWANYEQDEVNRAEVDDLLSWLRSRGVAVQIDANQFVWIFPFRFGGEMIQPTDRSAITLRAGLVEVVREVNRNA